jgi:hypothetical protein
MIIAGQYHLQIRHTRTDRKHEAALQDLLTS